MKLYSLRGRRWLHGLIIGVIAATTVSIRGAFRERYREERRMIEARGRSQSIQEVAAQWNSLAFSEVTTTNLADVLLPEINFSLLELSELQEGKFRTRLREVLDYLQSPSFSEYFRLKTEGLHYKFEPSKFSAQRSRDAGDSQILEIYQGLNSGAPVDAKAFVQDQWERLIAQTKGGMPANVSAIHVDDIGLARCSTNSLQAILGGRAKKGFTVGTVALDPGFEYGESTPKKRGQDLFVHLSFYARSSSSTNAGPVYLSFYWSPLDQEWALSRMITDGLLRINLLF